MDIERGHNYLCIRDVCMNGDIHDVRFTKGKVYYAIAGGYLIDDEKDNHGIHDYPNYGDFFATEHFVEIPSAETLLKDALSNL